MSGALVVVGTPIGNLEDMSPRAVRALREAGMICCEDTRRTRKLLSALGVPAPRLVRLDSHTEMAAVAPVVAAVEGGETVVLVSDAGMPTVSDPGSLMVKGVAAAGLAIDVVPGPCAVSAALALSGLPAGQYTFMGFLPRKGPERRQALARVAGEPATAVIYEAPNRVAATVDDLVGACGADRELVMAREITKLHQEVWRGPLGEGPGWLAGAEPRGEWVLVLGPVAAAPVEAGAEAVDAALRQRFAAGLDRRRAVAEVAAELEVRKRLVYEAAVRLKGEA